jgi:hypothetical protein
VPFVLELEAPILMLPEKEPDGLSVGQNATVSLY